jgi:hypothetical protein
MSKRQNLYLGKAGQLLVMSEFLARGWNVATPEVDVGDDLFVVEDKEGIFFRVQVKTATVLENQLGFSARFNVPIEQITSPINPDLYFVFVLRKNSKWSDCLVVPRTAIDELLLDNKFGSKAGKYVLLNFIFKNEKVFCSDVDFSRFLNNFEDFPIINH